MSLRNSSLPAAHSERPRHHILCYVTDRRGLFLQQREHGSAAILDKIESVAAAGVAWIQIREKDLSGRACSLLTREALRRVSKLGSASVSISLIVNGRLDVALSERAGGVHLGENSLPAAEAKRLVLASQEARTTAKDFLVGVSCHSLDSAKAAAVAGASYVFFGPVFATPSKTSFGAPQGLQRLAEVCAAVNIPVLAIGGITLENAPSCFSSGAAGIAAIRLFQDAPDLTAVIRALRQKPG